MPNNMVIDISHHNQGTLDFVAARAAGVVGVICKATQGTSYKDPTYSGRRTAALSAGLLWGAYHFGTAADVDHQVANFLGKVGLSGDMLYAMDYEKNEQTPANTMSLAQAREFLRKLDQSIGRPGVVYGGRWMKEHLGNQHDAFLGSNRLWFAQYGSAPQIPPTWSSYWLWQFTDGHHGPQPHSIAGIGNCDIDHFDGTEAELRAQWP